jgi:hypothetical protein
MATQFAIGTWLSLLDHDKQIKLYAEFKAASGKSARSRRSSTSQSPGWATTK